MSKNNINFLIGKKAHTAMRHYLDDRLVPIVIQKKERFEEIGSGTCIKINNHYFIFTAGHIIKKQKKNEYSLMLASWELERQNITTFLKTGFIDDDKSVIDVGYIEISKSSAELLDKKFIDSKVITKNVCELEDDDVIVSGYPAEIITVDKTEKYNIHTVRASHYRTSTIGKGGFPRNLSSTKHIILKYPRIALDEKGKDIEIHKAPGMSGGSIWAMNAQTKGIWSPDKTSFIGIQIAWHEKRRYLVGMQIQYLINLISSEYSDIMN